VDSVAANTPAITFVYSGTTNSSVVVPTQTSLFWQHLSVGVPSGTSTTCQINGLQFFSGIATTTTNYPNDYITSDTLQWVAASTALSVSNVQQLISNTSYQTAWLGIRLDNCYSPLVAFSVAVNVTSPITGLISFNRMLVNEGSAWSPSANTFTAPTAGLYFFSITSPDAAGGNGGTTVVVNLTTTQLNTCNCGGSQNGNMIIRGAVMLQLNAGDTVQFRVHGTIKGGGMLNAQGFLYSPMRGPQIAWSVFYVATGFIYNIFAGPVDPIPYNVIAVNMGGAFNVTSYTVQISVPGRYFVDVTGYMCGRGFNFISSLKGNNVMYAMLNSNAIIQLSFQPDFLSNCITRSRSTIVMLNAGDVLRVNSPVTGSGFYGDSNHQLSFTGFKIC
jgi:hypothetical protein